jgi:hypothetical protein
MVVPISDAKAILLTFSDPEAIGVFAMAWTFVVSTAL